LKSALPTALAWVTRLPVLSTEVSAIAITKLSMVVLKLRNLTAACGVPATTLRFVATEIVTASIPTLLVHCLFFNLHLLKPQACLVVGHTLDVWLTISTVEEFSHIKSIFRIQPTQRFVFPLAKHMVSLLLE
jgi:hypothetical protein